MRTWLVGIAAEALRGDEDAAIGDCKSSAGKGALGDAVAEDAKGASELGFLLVKSRLQDGFRLQALVCGLLIIACPRTSA